MRIRTILRFFLATLPIYIATQAKGAATHPLHSHEELHGLFSAHQDAVIIIVLLCLGLVGMFFLLHTFRKRTNKAERQLGMATEKYASLFHHASEGIVLVNREGLIEDINPKACSILGVFKEQVLGASGANLVHPDDAAITSEQRRRLNAGMTARTSRRVLTRKGTYVSVEVSVKHISESLTQMLIRDLSPVEKARAELEVANRELAAMYEQMAAANEQLAGANRELHFEMDARSKAEAEVRERESLLDSVLRSAPIGIGMLKDRIIGWTNKNLQTMVGYSGEELEGQSARIFYENDAEFQRVADVKHPQIEKNQFGSVETSFVSKDGKVTNVLLSSGTIVPGDMSAGLIFSVQDLTELYKAHQENRELRELLFQESSMAQMLIDPSTGLIAEANAASLDFFGRNKEETIGLHINKLLRASDLTASEALDMAASGKEPVHFFLDHPGENKTVEAHAGNLNIQNKGIRHVIFHDISEREKAQRALLEAKDLAEDASRMKNEFLANMSHEVRTPLNGMLGMLQLLQDTTLTTEQTDLIGAALQSGQGLHTLLNDLLDFSIIEAGRLSLTADDINLHTLLNSITMVFRRQCLEKSIQLELSIEPDVPTSIHGDVGRLRQVLFNLIGNAVKFTPKGYVRLQVQTVNPHGRSDLRLMFTVEDSGIGIEEQKIRTIFEPFMQADGSMTRKYEGAGLGLSIVHRLTMFMKGNICVESWPGEGTKMHVVIPFAAATPTITVVENPPPLQPLNRNRKVLIAEDNPVNRIAAERFVQKLGFDVRCVTNGSEALEELRKEHFDCILMDVQMPVMTGTEATKMIRSDTSGDFDPAIPVVAMTAHAMAGDRERFLEQGMTAYLAKPVAYDDLERTLGQCL